MSLTCRARSVPASFFTAVALGVRLVAVLSSVIHAALSESRTSAGGTTISAQSSVQRPVSDDDIRRALEDENRRREEWNAARRLEAGLDPGLVALRDCDHAVRNASGAPWTVEGAARECAERLPSVDDSHPQFFGGLLQMVWDDFVGLSKLGLAAFDRYGTASDPGQTFGRDINGGVLHVQSEVGKYLSSPEELSRLDPLRLVQGKVEEYRNLVRQNPGRGAAKGAYDILKELPLPTCARARGPILAVSEAQAIRKAEQIGGTLTDAARRGRAFHDGWGNRPHTGASGTGPVRVRGTVYNPECGEYNCFAVAIAKSRGLATGRTFSASAIRPNMTADVVITTGEIHDLLKSTFGWRLVRDHRLYTTQELFDHALGLPTRMDMQRIAAVLNRSGHGAQGLVFVEVPAAKPRFPGETVGHVFNAYNENGVVRFIDETGESGADARRWFNAALDVWFYEVN